MRLAAMMRLQVVYVFTHDSIFLGEDGPTDQPVEQLPGLRLFQSRSGETRRPLEVAMAWTRGARAPGRPDGPSS